MSFFSSSLKAAAAVALACGISSAALAAATTAGTTITNNAAITYKVNAISQTAVASSDSVTVDRVINMTSTSLSGGTINVTPGQTGVTVAIKVTNTSNAPVTFEPVVQNSAYDGYRPPVRKLYLDRNRNGTYDAGVDLEVSGSTTNLPVVAADASATYFAVIDIPSTVTNGQNYEGLYFFYAREPNTTGNAVTSRITATSGANTAEVDTVLNDGKGVWDAVRDGLVVTQVNFTAASANLTAVRTSVLRSDPVNGATNPKIIPGASREFCIAVSNGADSTTATDVTITETIDTNYTYDETYGTYINGTVTNGVCNADGTKGGTFANGKITATLGSIAASATKTILYRATVK